MAITQDATAKSTSTAASSLTYSHTCTGSDRLLVLGGVTINDATDVVTGVTYNGVAMTRIDSQGYAGVARAYFYYLIAPASGANNVVVSFTGTTHNSQFQSISYTGAKQTGQPDASASNAAAVATSVTNTLTTVANNSIHLAYVRVSDTAPTGTTGTFVYGPGSPGTEGFYITSPTPVTPAGSSSIQVSGASQTWVAIGASFAPTVAVTTVPDLRLAFL